MRKRSLFVLVTSLFLFTSVAASQNLDLELENAERFRETVDVCDGTCTMNDTLSMDASSDELVFDTGDTGYCGTAGFSYSDVDLEDVDEVVFDADIDAGSWAGSTGLRVNGEYVWEKDPSGSSISSNFETEQVNVSDISDSSAELSFIVKDTSREWCNMFDHSISAEYSNVDLVEQGSDDGGSDDSNSSDDPVEDAAEVIVEVVNENQQPVSNASVTLDDSGNDDYQNPRYTDEEGMVTFYENTGPAPANLLEVTVEGEQSETLFMNNGESETLKFEIEEGSEDDQIEGIGFEIDPDVVREEGEKVSFNLYDSQGESLEVENAVITVSRKGDKIQTEDGASLPRTDEYTSEGLSEKNWFMGDGNYSFEVSLARNGQTFTSSDVLTIDLEDEGDNNHSDWIGQMDLKLNRDKFEIGDSFKLSAADGEGDRITGEVTVDVYNNGDIVSAENTVELPVKTELTQHEVNATEWLSDSGKYKFKVTKINYQGQSVSDSIESKFDLGADGNHLNLDLSPSSVSPGEEFSLKVTDSQGEEVSYDNADVTIYTEARLEYKEEEEIESFSTEYPESRDSYLFHGYGSYVMQVDVETSKGSYSDRVEWELMREDSPDIYVESLEKRNNSLNAEVGLRGTSSASAITVLEVSGTQENISSTKNISLTEGQNDVVYDLPQVSGTRQVSVEVESEVVEENNTENNELERQVVFSEDTDEVRLTEGWNMISSASAISLDSLDEQCNLNQYQGHLAWRFSGGQWTHPESLAANEGFLVNSAEECTAEVGTQPSGTARSLSEGWNIISVESSKPLSEISGNCEFNQYRGSKIYHFRGGEWSTFNMDEELDPSRGYYVNAEEACGLETIVEPPTPTGSFISSATEMIGGLVG